jgi:hypothetical protein
LENKEIVTEKDPVAIGRSSGKATPDWNTVLLHSTKLKESEF